MGFDADPASVYDAQRNAAAHGVAVRFDVRGADAVTGAGPFDLVHCLPVAMAEQPSAAIGTVIRAGTVHALATAAGLPRVESVPSMAGSSGCIGCAGNELWSR